jgi:hypothetical protein
MFFQSDAHVMPWTTDTPFPIEPSLSLCRLAPYLIFIYIYLIVQLTEEDRGSETVIACALPFLNIS